MLIPSHEIGLLWYRGVRTPWWKRWLLKARAMSAPCWWTLVTTVAGTVAHETWITESRSYWWHCSCGDEGGPHESFNDAWDATVDHERGVR